MKLTSRMLIDWVSNGPTSIPVSPSTCRTSLTWYRPLWITVSLMKSMGMSISKCENLPLTASFPVVLLMRCRREPELPVGEQKRDPLDFALWKAAKPGEPAWDSPWGRAAPVGILNVLPCLPKYLGKTFDIHGGGADLIFPHHENEIAQSEGCNGCESVHYWIHNGFITINSEKCPNLWGTFSFSGTFLINSPALWFVFI